MEPEEPLISVIIPTCRRPELLKEAVASVLAQTWRHWELIVVDDDPEGSARGAVESFCDVRIAYERHTAGRGGSAARNTGLARARGEFVAFLDDDDVWFPAFLQKMVKAFAGASSKAGLVYCPVEFMDQEGRRRYSRRRGAQGDIFASMLAGDRPMVGTVVLVRRRVFEVCGGFDESLPSAQDWDMWLRVTKQFSVVCVDEVLARVRDFGVRISSDPLRPSVSREIILRKYADDLERHPKARIILLKRLGKINALLGRWKEAWPWFRQAAGSSVPEWARILAWLVLQRPFAVRPGEDLRQGRYFGWVLLLGFSVACYGQWDALVSPLIVNDDACQHIWWLRMFSDPGLFKNDLLAVYAQQLEHAGLWVFYRMTAGLFDPLKFAAFLPLVLLPFTAGVLYRLVLGWSRDAYTALLTSAAFMVTPLYLQHMTGGQAHVLGYPLALLVFYFLMKRAYRGLMYTSLTAVLFFPVMFAVSVAVWAVAWVFRRASGRKLLITLVLGFLVLAGKFELFASAQIGHVLSRAEMAQMPELSSAGRWVLWPVPRLEAAAFQFAEQGVFVITGMHKTFFPPGWKDLLLGRHVFMVFLLLAAAAWWWRQRSKYSMALLGWVAAASALLYLTASAVMLRMYAPDRYLSYTIPPAGLLFIMIPVGMIASSWPGVRWRKALQALLLLVVLGNVTLVKGAGLTDYRPYKELYAFLSTLPKDALIAAYPDTADGIPLFARRSVLVNKELSVPLFDRYWEALKARTYDLLGAYYAADAATVRSFCHRYGVTHLVVEHHRYTNDFLAGDVYFEPFGSWIKSRIGVRRSFYFNQLPASACVWAQGDMCVLDVRRWP